MHVLAFVMLYVINSFRIEKRFVRLSYQMYTYKFHVIIFFSSFLIYNNKLPYTFPRAQLKKRGDALIIRGKDKSEWVHRSMQYLINTYITLYLRRLFLMRSYTPYFFFFYRTTFLLYIIFVFFFSFLTVRHLQISKGKGKMNRLNNNRRIIIRYLLPNCPKKNERTVLLK